MEGRRQWKIGWETRFVDYLPGPWVNDPGAGGELFGSHLAGQEAIKVNTDFSEDQQRATTLHELFHAIVNQAGLGLTEEQLTGLANLLYGMMKDNKDNFEELLV